MILHITLGALIRIGLAGVIIFTILVALMLWGAGRYAHKESKRPWPHDRR